jgi:rare lipoprotein A
MRRLAALLAAFVFLAACHHGKARANVPTSKPSAVKVSDADLEGIASYYAEPYHGRRTANGEVFDTYNHMTAAHKTLPFNTVVRVKNLNNGEEVDVRINDRGPFIKGRVIDLSLVAAKEIDLVRPGVAPVKLKILKEGSPTTKPSVPTPTPTSTPPVVPAPTPPPDTVPVQQVTPQDPATAPSNPGIPVYGVQIGAFQSESAAVKLRDDLALRYTNVSIQTVVADQTMYRVRVGSVPDMAAAEQLAKQLRDERFNTFIVRLN